jgi:hypothetical protein
MTILFFISLFGLIILFVSKSIEINKGNVLFWTEIIKKADLKVHNFKKLLERKIGLYKKIAHLFVFEFLPSYLYENVSKFKDFIYKKYYESTLSLKGNKKVLRSNGSVSAFLQDIKKPEETGFFEEKLIGEEEREEDKKEDGNIIDKN